jgi:hypothetical protein
MFRRLPRRARKVLTVLGVLMVILGGIAAFTGCQSGNSEEKQGEDLEFTVTGEADIPAALKETKSGKNHSSLHTRTGWKCISSSARVRRKAAATAWR